MITILFFNLISNYKIYNSNHNVNLIKLINLSKLFVNIYKSLLFSILFIIILNQYLYVKYFIYLLSIHLYLFSYLYYIKFVNSNLIILIYLNLMINILFFNFILN